MKDSVEFELAFGLKDFSGVLHRRGSMRRARVGDELEALRDFRVFLDPHCMLLVLLSKVVSFERLTAVTPALLEGLVVGDRQRLEKLYRELNGYPAYGTDGLA
jgi:hypothetical protein